MIVAADMAGRAHTSDRLLARGPEWPARIGPYVLARELGRGGTGVVFAGTDSRTAEPVAIKVLWKGADSVIRARFLREGRLASRVKHPNLAEVHEVVCAGDETCIVMDLVPGTTLRDRLCAAGAPEVGLPVREALWISVSVCRALAAAHERGIVHRDVKPANVMIRKDGWVKLLDFGIAKHLAGAGAPDREPPSVRTEDGTVLGTPGYMPPEQARGETVDPRADVFAAGVVIYEMLTGKNPFRGATMLESILAAVDARPEPPSALTGAREAGVSDLDAIVMRCLEKDPAGRFEDAGALGRALGEVAGRDPLLRGTWLVREGG